MDHRSVSFRTGPYLGSSLVIQPLLEGVDRWCLYNVLRQGIPTVNDSLGEEELQRLLEFKILLTELLTVATAGAGPLSTATPLRA